MVIFIHKKKNETRRGAKSRDDFSDQSARGASVMRAKIDNDPLSSYQLMNLIDKKIYPKKYYERHLEKKRELYNGPFVIPSSPISPSPSPSPQVGGGFLERSNPIAQLFEEWAFHMIGALIGVLVLIILLVKFHIKIF